MNTQTPPFEPSDCICRREWRAPNATPTAPYFSGIRRFGAWRITSFDPECGHHGHVMSEYGLAAALRYDLPLGTR